MTRELECSSMSLSVILGLSLDMVLVSFILCWNSPECRYILPTL